MACRWVYESGVEDFLPNCLSRASWHFRQASADNLRLLRRADPGIGVISRFALIWMKSTHVQQADFALIRGFLKPLEDLDQRLAARTETLRPIPIRPATSLPERVLEHTYAVPPRLAGRALVLNSRFPAAFVTRTLHSVIQRCPAFDFVADYSTTSIGCRASGRPSPSSSNARNPIALAK